VYFSSIVLRRLKAVEAFREDETYLGRSPNRLRHDEP